MNRCEADRERRQRAMNDAELIQRVGNLERRITFMVGYDHRAFPEDCGGGGHGQHGMEMRFTLIGPHGAVAWSASMHNWVPGNIMHGRVEVIDDDGKSIPVSLVPANASISDGSSISIDYHALGPTYDGHEGRVCHLLPSEYCYFDVSYMAAEPLLEAFVNHGPMAVWAALARFYADVLAAEAER